MASSPKEEDVVSFDEPELISEADRELFLVCVKSACSFDRSNPEWKAMLEEKQKRLDANKSKSMTQTKVAAIHLHYETTQSASKGTEDKLVVLLAKHRKNKMLEQLARVALFAGNARAKSQSAKKSDAEAKRNLAAEAERKAKEAKKKADELSRKPVNLSNAEANAFAVPKKVKRSNGAKRDGGVVESMPIVNDTTKSNQASSSGSAAVDAKMTNAKSAAVPAVDSKTYEALLKEVEDLRLAAAEKAKANAIAAAEKDAKYEADQAAFEAKNKSLLDDEQPQVRQTISRDFGDQDDVVITPAEAYKAYLAAKAKDIESPEAGSKRKAEKDAKADVAPSPGKKPRFDRDRSLSPPAQGAQTPPTLLLSELRIEA